MNGTATFVQMFTRKSGTYGVTVPDYHSLVHGSSALHSQSELGE